MRRRITPAISFAGGIVSQLRSEEKLAIANLGFPSRISGHAPNIIIDVVKSTEQNWEA